MSRCVLTRGSASAVIASASVRPPPDATGPGSGPLAGVCAVGVALDVALALAGDSQRAGRDVVGDDRARSGVGPVAHGDGRDERRVDAAPHVGADRGPVLLTAVVV